MLVKIIFIVVFFGIMTAVGLACRKHAADVNGFVLGGRRIGPWLTAFAYGTSYFSAVIFVGYAGQFGWRFGIASTWIGLGNAMIGSLLAWALLGRRTRIMTQHLSSATMPQFFERRFDSATLKLASAAIIFVFLIPYTASLYNGLSRLFAMAFDADYAVCIAVMACLTAIYVIAGGYMATAVNDFIQGIVMLFGIAAIIASVLKINGGFTGSLDALANVTDASVTATPGIFASFFGPDPVALLFVVILTSLGTWGLPQMVQKFYAIKSEDDIKKGTVISTVFALVVAGGCYFLGGFGRLTDIDVSLEGYDAIIPRMLSELSPIICSVALILVLSASMSTLSSLVLTSSSTLTLDFISPVIRKGRSKEKEDLFTIRVFVAIFIFISAAIAIVQYRTRVTFIAQLMGLSWGALAGAFLAPFLFGLYWRGTTKAACLACFVWGPLVMTANMLFGSSLPTILRSPINCGAFAMLGGMVIVPAVSLLSKKPDKERVESIFACYDRKVTVPISDALTDASEH